MANRVSGIIQFKIDGENFPAKGSFTYSYGRESREAIIGSDGIHGYKTTVVPPMISGAITDDGSISIDQLANVTDATVMLNLGNGKVFVLRNAWSNNPDGIQGSTEESEIAVSFTGKSAEDVAV